MDVAALLTESRRQWLRRPPATDSEIKRLQSAASSTIPEEYLALLRFSNGGEGPLALPPLYFMLYEAELATHLNESANQHDLYPGHFVFGRNGGVEAIAFDTRCEKPWPIVMYDGVAGLESSVIIAKNMSDFILAIGIDEQE